MNNLTIPEIHKNDRKRSLGDLDRSLVDSIQWFKTPTCRSSIKKNAHGKHLKVARKRLSFSPNINSVTMPSPDISPINGENSFTRSFRTPTKSPIFDFSPRAINQILKKPDDGDKKNASNDSSILNKTITVDSILRNCKMDKYIDVFMKQEIDLLVFCTLTDGDLMEIGIKSRKDRKIILGIVAEYQN